MSEEKVPPASSSRLLKEKRLASGLSQLEIAKTLGYSSGQFVSNWERGLCSRRWSILQNLLVF